MLDKIPERYIKKIVIDEVRGCWLWQGEVNANGYGRAWFKNRRYVVHRLLYWLSGKKFNLDDYTKELDHLCEVRHCCNPEHMEVCNRITNAKRIYRRRKRINSKGQLVF